MSEHAAAFAGASRISQGSSWSDLDTLRATTPMFDAVIDEIHEREIRIGDQWFVDFASCNYLGFDLDQEIISRIDGFIRRWGTHPSWSRLLGNPSLYPEIEERLTELLGAPDTLVLPTITHIHMSVIPALAAGGRIFLERLAHKTIYDGCRYARGLGATVRRFTDGDLGELEDLLRAAPPGPRLVCLDGVNSMTGNLPNLSRYARLCREYDATLYVDDAHGFGVIGERSETETSPYGCRGNSCVRYFGESYDNIVLVGGFSKAYSSLLAFLALPTKLKHHLKVAAPPYLYSGPSPVASLAGVLAGFDVNYARGDALRAKLYQLTARLLDRARRCGLEVRNVTGTPILELPMAAGRDLRSITRTLWQSGIYVTVAAYPLVPREDVGFRVQLTARHTESQIDHLASVIEDLAEAGQLRQAGPSGPA